MEIKALTKGPRHHFFGFHDVVCSNRAGSLNLALEIDIIDRPPIPGKKVTVGVVESESGNFKPLAETEAFNFPQGARQQWLPLRDEFIFNSRVGNGWGSIRMTPQGESLSIYNQAIYHLNPNGKIGLGLNFERMHRLGGYGYVGIQDYSKAADAYSGLTEVDLASGEVSSLLRLQEVISFGDLPKVKEEHHFLTHALWNPSGTKIAFLHRFWLADGGQITRLMQVNHDGKQLKLIAQGHLSHFDWINDENLMIWGRQKSMVDSMRSLSGPMAHIVVPVLFVLRKIKRHISRKEIFKSQSSYLRVCASKEEFECIGNGVLVSDGHPMVNRLNPEWVLADTYPDDSGVRYLFLYNFFRNQRIELGYFKKLKQLPILDDLNAAQFGFDPGVLLKFDSKEFAFTRSGLHCDLHPRWWGDFKRIAFDSIHEGTRQIYWMDVTNKLNG